MDNAKKKILFVSPRYGLEVNGGAEMECRAYAEHLTEFYDVSVLTTCAKDHMTWRNEYAPGETEIHGVRVIRVESRKERNLEEFYPCVPIAQAAGHTRADEVSFIEKQGPYCPALVKYLEAHGKEYAAVFFVTYLYYPIIRGIDVPGIRPILIPTVHDEWVAHLEVIQDVFQRAKGYVYNTAAEKVFAERQYASAAGKPSCVVGYGIEVPAPETLPAVKEKYGLEDYILYAGRVDEAKGCGYLFQYFRQFKRHHPSGLKLVLCGKPGMEIPEDGDIAALGFVSEEDKYALMKDAKVLVLASQFESLSIVVLEAMMSGTPVLVNGECQVLKDHCLNSDAGLYFSNYTQFERTLTWLLTHPAEYAQMQANGRDYVLEHYQWPDIIRKISELIEEVTTRQ